MDAIPEWRSAFPLQTAIAASEALLRAWRDLASPQREHFNPSTKEPRLTKALTFHVRYVASHERLAGHWVAESIIGKLNPNTAEIVEERRPDITYLGNDFQLVFEFKRLKKGKGSINQYLGQHGLARFVTGIYSKGQAVAAMVGVLLAPETEIVPPIKAALDEADRAKALHLRGAAKGRPYTEPSTLFPKAAFDTEHDREPELAPPHGYIRVAHFFVNFG